MKALFFTAVSCLLASAVLCSTTTAAPSTTVAGNTTSAAPTTTGNTSAAPTTTVNTTTAPTTTAPAVNTTTVPATTTEAKTTIPPPTDEFELKNGNKTCLKAKLSAFFTVTYLKKDNTTDTADVPIPKSAKPSGQCANAGLDPILTLTFDGYVAQFNFSQKAELEGTATLGRVYLSSVSFKYDESSAKLFPNATDTKTQMSAENDNFDLKMSANNTFFQCQSQIEKTVGPNVTLTFDSLKVQVYDVNNTYSGDGEICAADKSTTSSPTTKPVTTPVTTPATTPVAPTLPTTPPSGNWSVKGQDDIPCILATMGARFTLNYKKSDNKSESVEFDLPVDATTKGSVCSNSSNSDILQLDFFGNYSLKLIFKTKSAKAQLSADQEYFLQNISLTYYQDSTRFPNALDGPGKAMVVSNNKEQFNTQVGQAYLCNIKVDIDFGNGNKLDTFNLKIQAFKSSNTTDFDEFTECTADNATSNIVPIAVGAALAALVVIVLIAYVIGRRRSRSGYESV